MPNNKRATNTMKVCTPTSKKKNQLVVFKFCPIETKFYHPKYHSK